MEAWEMAAGGQGWVCTAHWEGAQAPIVRVLICYSLLGRQMNTSCLFLKKQSSAKDSDLYREKYLQVPDFFKSFRKINLEQNSER